MDTPARTRGARQQNAQRRRTAQRERFSYSYSRLEIKSFSYATHLIILFRLLNGPLSCVIIGRTITTTSLVMRSGELLNFMVYTICQLDYTISRHCGLLLGSTLGGAERREMI